MALFRRSLYGEDPNFTNLFRLLDDFDHYTREVSGNNTTRANGRQSRLRAINPRFDVRETETAYELYGELPGIDRKDVSIEFTEPQTMVVRGHVERTYSSGTPPAGLVEDTQMSGAITERGETSATPPPSSHKATVSDEETENAKEQGETAVTKPAAKETPAPKSKPKEHFWHQERSVGEFHRTFTFPGRVDDSNVTASLANGILHVTVPKATKHESRRIAVN